MDNEKCAHLCGSSLYWNGRHSKKCPHYKMTRNEAFQKLARVLDYLSHCDGYPNIDRYDATTTAEHILYTAINELRGDV